MKLYPDAPAYPHDELMGSGKRRQYFGITIRQELAARFMAAHIASCVTADPDPTLSAKMAFKCADAFIRAENGEEKQ